MRILNRLFGPLLVIAGLAVVPAWARADFIVGWAGNTHPVHPTGTAGFVDAAVFDRANGVSGDSFNLGAAGIDTVLSAHGFNISSQFLYLYQTVNTGNVGISLNTVRWNPAFDTTLATLSALAGFGFHDAGGNMSTSNTLGTPAPGGDISIFNGDGSAVTVTAQSGLQTPTVAKGPTSLKADYGTAELPISGVGSVWGYTSDLGPIMGLTGIIDNGSSADGFAPMAGVPEPASALLAVLGVSAFGLLARFRRRRVVEA